MKNALSLITGYCPATDLPANTGSILPLRRHLARFLLTTSLLLPATPALSASGPEEPESLPPEDGDIQNMDVIGRRPEEIRLEMEEFILEVGDPAVPHRGYARWRDRLCVGMYNLPDPSIGQYLADQIMNIALETGLKAGSPGCEPNLKIVFSPDARELATQMVEDTPTMFLPYGDLEGTTQGLPALEQFKTSDAPVRWWQITMPVDEIGFPAIQLPGMEMPEVRSVASRLKGTVSDAIWGSLIIVDASKLQNVKWPQLADYLAMVSLAQISPNALPAGHDSILNLFSAELPPRGLTDMDRTYLRSLYDIDTLMLPHSQRGILSHRMVRVQRDIENGE